MTLKIRPLCADDLSIAVEMSLETYHLERQYCSALPINPNTDFVRQQLHAMIEEGFGGMATEADIPIGFSVFEKSYPAGDGTYGATSPLFGYGIRHEKRDSVMGKLFQYVAAELCRNYVNNFCVNVYAHDAKVLWMYIMSAFAMDVTEGVKGTEVPINYNAIKSFTYREVSKDEHTAYQSEIVELYRDLVNHLRVSPVFYHCKYFLPLEDRFNDFLSENLRLFAAFEDDRLVGMVNSEPVDIALFRHDLDSLCMGDVFIKPDYRGNGVAAALLEFANYELRKDGVKRLFVTHGTINPNARGFWDKYFTNYSYTMTRVIDSDMLGEIERV